MGFCAKTLWLLLLGAALCLSGCATLDEDDSGTFTLDLEGRVAVIVLDNSGGPEEFDPEGVVREGAKLLLSTFSDADNVGVVTVRFPVRALLEITNLAEEGARARALESLEAMKIGGDAEYYEALRKARELLDIFSAQRDSAIVFLTGGRKRPSGNPQEIRDLMDLFASRGWRFFPVVLTPAPDLLGVLEYGAARTQGAVFKAERPVDVMSTLISVAGKINDLWLRRDLTPAVVAGGARRLLVAVTADEGQPGVERVLRDDADVPVPDGGPGAGRVSSPAFSLLSFPEPQAGTWSGAATGSPASSALFVSAPFRAYLDDEACVKGSALEGDEVSFHIVVDGEKEALQAWAPKGRSEVTLVSETTGKVVERFTLDRTFIPPTVRFAGKTRLFTTVPGEPEVFTARVSLVFGEGEGAWTREEYLSFELKPAVTRAFRVEPPEVDLGTRWWDEKDISRTVEVVARVEEPMDVSTEEASEGLVLDPPSVSASLRARGMIRVALGDAPRAAGGQGSLSFKVVGSSTGEEGMAFDRVVPVRYRLVKFVGPSTVDLERMAPGEEKRIPLASWSVAEGSIPFTLELANLEGPGLIVPTLVEEAGGRILVVAIPGNARAGLYEGRMVVVPGEKGLGNRFVPVKVEVVPESEGPARPTDGVLQVTPASLDLTAEATGWVRASFLISVPEEGVAVTMAGIRVASMRGKSAFEAISGTYDIRVTPAAGWDGKELGRGRQASYVLEVYVSSDLPDDEYEGEAIVQYRVGGSEGIQEIPVGLRITLNRSR